jgi:type I restriction enzyme S subunit
MRTDTIKEPALQEPTDRVGIEFYSRWKEVKLADVAVKFAMGPFGSNIKAENFTSSGVPVIRGTNLNFYKYVDGDFVFLTEEKANDLKSSNCFPGDLVFTHRGTLGQVGLIPFGKYDRYIISQSGMKVTINSKLVDNNWLFYFFKSNLGQYELLKNESQVGVPSISNPLTSLKAVELKLPPLSEQTAIASILRSLDDKIDLLHRQNKTLEQLAETLFRQWFVEEAEESWEHVTIGEFVKTNHRSISKDYLFQEIEYLDTSSLTEGLISETQKIALKDAPSRAKRLVQNNDLLISTVRPDQKHYGIINNPTKNFVVSTGFCVITCSDIEPHFIYLLLTSDEMTQYLHSIAEGSTSTYPSLKPSDIEKIEFLKPPIERMSEFSTLASTYWTKIHSNQTQIRTLTQTRDTLLPKLMSGEVRVRFN